MEFETRKNVSVNEYIGMIRQKTAVLLGFSLELGALLSGANEKHKIALRNLGVNIGIGFQLKDDLLVVYGDKKTFGKQVGGDILSNKKTFLLIKALERAKGKDKLELTKWLKAPRFDNKKKVKAVTSLYDRLHIKSLTETEINYYFTMGLSGLQGLPKSENRDKLGQFLLSLMKRNR
jgi:geranylgeranyl diphosphate synthase type II